jgi:excinuclease ABC subunit C
MGDIKRKNTNSSSKGSQVKEFSSNLLTLEKKLNRLPDSPGVYLLKDEKKEVLYVGKALSLKKRVRSYFQRTSFSPRIHSLVSQIKDLEWLITDSEAEAFLLESNLIKHHRPRYNIQLRDDKSYPYIKLTTYESFPRVFLTRNPKEDGALYFGPYTNVKAARKSLGLIQRLFPLRRCKGKFKLRSRPCLNYHIKECSGPCVKKISSREYASLTRGVSLFLQGHYESLLSQLEKEMEEASRNEKFERAAKLRDLIRAIHRIGQTQKVASFPGGDRDLIGVAYNSEEACVVVFQIREGKVVGKKHFLLKIGQEDEGKDILTFFIKQYYAKVSFVPPEVLLQYEITDQVAINRWLSERRGGKIKLDVPQRGKKVKLMRLVIKNARLILQQEKGREKNEALLQLKNYLDLKEKPSIIEGFDVSNIKGKEATGSVVVFREGKAEPSSYRRFKIKTVKGINDFAMLSEVVKRRYQRLLKESHSLPGLILIDGGKGQLSSCLKMLKQLGLGYISLVGLAKEFEEVYLPSRSLPLDIPHDSAALRLLQEIRDEAHRFAYSYHRKVRQRKMSHSSLDYVPGVGEKTKKTLLTHFSSVSLIKNKSLEELRQIPGIGEKTARRILECLRASESH